MIISQRRALLGRTDDERKRVEEMKTTRIWALGTAGAAALAVMALGYVGLNGASFNGAEAAANAAMISPTKVDNFQLTDQNLDSHELYRLADAKAVVLITQMDGCPIMRNIASAVKDLQKTYAGKGVEFMMLNSTKQDTREEIAAEAKEWGFDMPILMDKNQLVGEQLGVTRTAEIIVIDPKSWKVVYHGPIDDRVTYERQKAKADNHYAADALDAQLAGKTVKVAQRLTEGCLINFDLRDKAANFSKISYVKEIAPIIEQKCVACHQTGGIGPMELTSYEKVKGFAPMIREAIRTKRMPPFHAEPGIGSFHDDKSLSPDQTTTLVHWIEAGAQRGTGADPLAAVVHTAPEWPLGKPDLVLDVPAYTIPASGVVDYQRPYAVNPLTEGRWIRASTIKPGQRQGVHHILTGYMAEVPKDGKVSESMWGTSVGGYAVGAESTIMAPDSGTFLPAGGAIGFQNHYTPFGKEAVDKSQIGLYFYDKQPKYMMHSAVVLDASIVLPANTERHTEIAYLTFPKDALLFSAFPHAHYRAHNSELKIRYPDGTEKLLLALPKYDFNWQRAYQFAEPIKVPAGSKLIATYIYDNSKRNPANPDPNLQVTWGEQSFQEMLYTALQYRWVDETSASRHPEYDAALMATRTMGMLDDNIDGKIELSELKGSVGAQLKANFALIDANKDGGIDATELATATSFQQRGQRQASR
jgi:peroxiredoxin